MNRLELAEEEWLHYPIEHDAHYCLSDHKQSVLLEYDSEFVQWCFLNMRRLFPLYIKAIYYDTVFDRSAMEYKEQAYAVRYNKYKNALAIALKLKNNEKLAPRHKVNSNRLVMLLFMQHANSSCFWKTERKDNFISIPSLFYCVADTKYKEEENKFNFFML